MVKSTEVKYAGYNFKSILAARWAVFFNHLGIKYKYKKDGLSPKKLYDMPDFYLPELKLWVEVNQSRPNQEELEKYASFRNKRGVIVVFCGLPCVGEANLWCVDLTDSHGGVSEWGFNGNGESINWRSSGDKIFLVVGNKRSDRSFCDNNYNRLKFLVNEAEFLSFKEKEDVEIIVAAKNSAVCARF